MLVAMLAVIHALQGKKVDVVTTSSELLRREVAKQAEFFSLFNLSVGEHAGGPTEISWYERVSKLLLSKANESGAKSIKWKRQVYLATKAQIIQQVVAYQEGS